MFQVRDLSFKNLEFRVNMTRGSGVWGLGFRVQGIAFTFSNFNLWYRV